MAPTGLCPKHSRQHIAVVLLVMEVGPTVQTRTDVACQMLRAHLQQPELDFAKTMVQMD